MVVVLFDMAEQAERTLYSLSPAYQRGIEARDYEVLVVENGSAAPLDPGFLQSLEGQLSYRRIEDAPPSPARALNLGVQQARGDFVGLMIDGARLLSPGLLQRSLEALEAFEAAVVVTLGFHLGKHLGQSSRPSSPEGDAELLRRIDWPADGYRLFDIAGLSGSSRGGWLTPPAESNAVFLRRALFDQVGGFDENFDLPGGGLVNHDFLSQVTETPRSELICLLGEATFHQAHGGVTTGVADVEKADRQWRRFTAQYREIRGKDWTALDVPMKLYGQPEARTYEWLALSGELAAAGRHGGLGPSALAAANRLGHRVAALSEQLAERGRWIEQQQRELDAQRGLLRQLEQQIDERTRWLRLQDDQLQSLRSRLEALESKEDAASPSEAE